MTNVTELKTRLSRNPAFTAAYNALPLASAAVITIQRALATTSAASLRAVADWNERKSYDERRRKARARHKAQCVALRGVAEQMERANREEGEWTNPMARAA